MSLDELVALFKPGMIARRPTWETSYTLEMRDGESVRLYCTRLPKFSPVWRRQGYDANASDYYFMETREC